MKTTLPEWFIKTTGDPLEPYTIWFDTQKFILSRSNQKDIICSNVKSLYELGASTIYGVAVDRTVHLVSKDFKDNNDYLILKSAISHLAAFEKIYLDYKDEQEDLIKAYNFIENHPALWFSEKKSKSIRLQKWSFSNAFKNIRIYPEKVDSLKLVFDTNALNNHIKLLIKEDSYERLIIQAAKQIDAIFNSMGNLK